MLLRPRCASALPLRRNLPVRARPLRGLSRHVRRPLVTLAIESSCDDTAVAVLSHTRHRTELLFNERISSDNRAFRGVHPVVSVQGHHASLAPLVQRAVLALPAAAEAEADADATLCRGRPDFVSVTRGPGNLANLAVGLNMAKGLAVAWHVPLVGVHHMQAHALTPRLAAALQRPSSPSSSNDDDNGHHHPHEPTHAPRFPFLTLLASGGHTQLVHSRALTEHHVLAATSDVAVGTLLDQTARVILPPELLASSPDVMYGRLLEPFGFDSSSSSSSSSSRPPSYQPFFRPARSRHDEMTPVPSDPYPWTVPLPFRDTRTLAYSFSSIHTHVHRIAAAIPPDDLPQRRCLARHTLRAAFQHLASRL
ncbi:hypothetical protein E4U41_005060, partial [Claviceps citrina]